MSWAQCLSLTAMNLAMILALMTSLWALSVIRRDASVVDAAWGLGFALVAVLSYYLTGRDGSRALLLTIVTVVWGARLSAFLLWRNWGEEEDRRYRAMRAKHQDRFWLVSLVSVFLLQGLLMWWISWPVQFGQALPATPLHALDLIGVVVWLIGMTFETVGDLQLARFRASTTKQGGVMDSGLWRYTRHPNYFGDFCVWWGIYLIAASGGAWWTLGSPLVMSFLLLRISGVQLLESTIVERRPGYAEYMRRTSAFFPRRPR